MPLRDQIEFFRQFRERFETTGSVLPSGRRLARAMTKELRTRKSQAALASSGEPPPIRILEIGPGTGAVTHEIIRQLLPSDHFDLVEINPKFGELLQTRFAAGGEWSQAAAQSKVHILPLQEFPRVAPYDVIISGLPFNNFPPPLVAELLEVTWSHLIPGGTYAFFEYMFVRELRTRVGAKATRERLTEIANHLHARFAVGRYHTDWVYLNVPPAWVQHLRKPA